MIMKYYQKKLECLDRKALKALQDEKLVKEIQHVWDHVPYYRKKMEAAGVDPSMIKGTEDLHLLPFTTKDDLREAYPDGLLAISKDNCVRLHSTSGTTGKRVLVYYSGNDVKLWNDCCARALCAAGANKKDICQIAYGYGLFTGGFGIHGGAEKLGCLTIPMSSGNTERQVMFMEDLETTVLCCTPSYAEYLAEVIEEKGAADKLKLRIGIFGAEAWSEEMRRSLETRLHLKAYDIYGLTELSGPGVAYECSEQNGMHINEDHFAAEIVDPVTLEPLPVGKEGELVFTSLSKEAFPVIRYRTRDICELSEETCSCGRTFRKMCRPRGRSDDMLIIKGVNVFPSQIETVLVENGYTANYQLIVDRVNNSDTLTVLVEMTPDMFTDNLGGIHEMEKDLTVKIKDMTGIYAKVKLAAPRSMVRSEGKAVRVIDNRKL